jgi:hypothetical protein
MSDYDGLPTHGYLPCPADPDTVNHKLFRGLRRCARKRAAKWRALSNPEGRQIIQLTQLRASASASATASSVEEGIVFDITHRPLISSSTSSQFADSGKR